MSALCLVIKKEPEEASTMCTDETQINGVGDVVQTEFVNIKMERGLESPGLRIKEEPLDMIGPSSLQEPDSTSQTTSYVQQASPDSSTADIGLPSLPKNTNHYAPELETPLLQPMLIQPVPLEIIPIEFNKREAERDPDPDYVPTDTSKEGKQKSCPYIFTEGKFACTLCDKMYSTHGNFKRHYVIHSLGTLQCKHCSKTFTTDWQLERHIKIHRTYDCDQCRKVFRSSSNLFQHKRVHMEVKPFKCPLCGKDFTVRANLLKHQGKSRCKIYNGPITCNVCHKIFKTEFLLKSHLRRHTTEKPFSCELCDMNFKYKSTLMRHNQMHSGVRPYSCDVCKKSFTHISLLRPHMRIHTGEKPYTCVTCFKRFAHKHNMERHAIRHSKEKKTVCEICNKKFPKESRLKYHMRTHVNEKFFCCYVCPKKFSHRQNVLRHYTRKHPNATYDCTDTDAKVATKLWEDVLKKKVNLTDKNKDIKKVEQNGLENDMENSEEEILPDNGKSSGSVPPKHSITKIVAALNEKIKRNYNQNCLGNEVLIKNEASDYFDSDEEVLANIRCSKTQTTNSNEKIGSVKTVGNETVVASNKSDNNIERSSDIQINIKREILSDEEEILPDVVNELNISNVEIKKELDL